MDERTFEQLDSNTVVVVVVVHIFEPIDVVVGHTLIESLDIVVADSALYRIIPYDCPQHIYGGLVEGCTATPHCSTARSSLELLE